MGASGTVLLGATGLAQTLTVVVALPLGAFGAYRLGRIAIGFRGPALAAGLAYGINPVARNAIAQGRLGPLVLFALLPYLLLRVVRLGERSDTRRGRRAAARGALRAARRVLPRRSRVVRARGARVRRRHPDRPRRAGDAARAFGIAIVASIGALVLLFPWPLAYAHSSTDKAALGFAFRPALDLSQVLRFDSGPASAGWVLWGLIIAAAVPLFVATGDRLAWTARGWVLALVGWATVWVPAQFFPHTSVLAPEAGLTLAALGLALCVGITVSVFVDGIHTFRFGWRQPAAIIGAVAIVLPTLAFTADVFDGSWDAPASGWAKDLAFTEAETSKGDFRMLWAGDPTELPLDPVVLRDGSGYVLTRNGPGDVTEQWRAPEHDADLVVDRALGLATAGLTNRLGRMLAPMGVRYVVVPSTQGRDGGAATEVPVRCDGRWRNSSTWRACGRAPGSCSTRTWPTHRSGRRCRPLRSRSIRHGPTAPRSAPTSPGPCPWHPRARRPRAPRSGARRTTPSGRRPPAVTRCATRSRSAGPTGTSSADAPACRSRTRPSGCGGRCSPARW